MKYAPFVLLTLGFACSSDHKDKPVPGLVPETKVQPETPATESLQLKQSKDVFPADGKMHLLSTIDAGDGELQVTEDPTRHVGGCLFTPKVISKSKIEIHASSLTAEACQTSFRVQVPSRKIDQTFAVEATSQAVKTPPEPPKDSLDLTQTVKEFPADGQYHVLATIDAAGSDVRVKAVDDAGSGSCIFAVVKLGQDKVEIRASSTLAGICLNKFRVEVADRDIDQIFAIEATAKAPAEVPTYNLNVATRLKKFTADSQDHLLAQVDLGGKALTLKETAGETRGPCTFKVMPLAHNSYELKIQSAKPGNCRALFHVQAGDSDWGKDFEVTAEATQEAIPAPDPTPVWKPFKVKLGDVSVSMESDGSTVRVVDYPLQFKSFFSIKDFNEDCAELESLLSHYPDSSPELQSHLRDYTRSMGVWWLSAETLPFLNTGTFSRKVLDAAKNQGIPLTAALIDNPLKMTNVTSRLTFAAGALTSHLGQEHLVDLLAQVHNRNILAVGLATAEIQAKDFLCDLQSGKANWTLLFTGEFQAGGSTKSYSPESPVTPAAVR